MNFLGHAWLSGDDSEIMAANVTGDAFKGKIRDELPEKFRAGLHLHRFIDRYTDTHEEFKKAAALLKPWYGRYAGVALDVWIDHILAVDFAIHHPVSLNEFSQNVYANLAKYHDLFNDQAKQVTKFMIEHNWLENYASFTYTQQVMVRMAHRFNAPQLATGGHPDPDTIKKIQLVFSNVAADLRMNANKKIIELLNK